MPSTSAPGPSNSSPPSTTPTSITTVAPIPPIRELLRNMFRCNCTNVSACTENLRIVKVLKTYLLHVVCYKQKQAITSLMKVWQNCWVIYSDWEAGRMPGQKSNGGCFFSHCSQSPRSICNYNNAYYSGGGKASLSLSIEIHMQTGPQHIT